MDSIVTILNDYLRGTRTDGPYVDIARFMLSHYDDLKYLRVSDVAEGSFVSSPTVIRFVRELGFENYSAFKAAVIANRTSNRVGDYSALDNTLAAEGDAYLLAAENWTDNIAQCVTSALKAADIDKVKRLAKDILNHQYVACIGYGMSGIFGTLLSSRLKFQGKGIISLGSQPSFTPPSRDPSLTLAIVVSQYGNLLRGGDDLLRSLHDTCDRIWLVTQVAPGRFNERVVDEVLYLEGGNSLPSSSFVLMAAADLVGQWCNKLQD